MAEVAIGHRVVEFGPVVESLSAYDEALGDPTREIYRRFYADFPQAVEELAFDRPLENRMMGGILALLADVADGTHSADRSMFWVSDHVAWDVDEAMILGMFAAVRDTIRDGLGERWTPATDVAWTDLLATLRPAVGDSVREAGGVTAADPE